MLTHLHSPSDLTVSGESYNIVAIATRVAAQKRLHRVSDDNDWPLPALPKSFSSPTLVQNSRPTPTRPRRSHSEFALGDVLVVQKKRSKSKSDCYIPLQQPFFTCSGDDDPTVHVQQPSSADSIEPASNAPVAAAKDEGCVHLPSDDDIHLHTMDISQQLRSMSQLSDVAEDHQSQALHYPWNFHHRELSDLGASSGRSRHSKQQSSSGVDSTTVPSSWGRVRTPLRDATSSVYSRPTSVNTNIADRNLRTPDIPAYEIPNDLNALFADWPLKPSMSAEETKQTLGTVSERSAGSERRNKPLPPTPSGSRKDSGTASFVTASNKGENSSVRFLSPARRPSHIPSKSSSSTLTRASKSSRLFERLSPRKKTVRKRRSIFKFLRPGSRKQQGRSISTPVLVSSSYKPFSTYDGPSDDPALLTVQYELTEQPSGTMRSQSMSHLGPGRHSDGASQLSAHTTLQRRPTMAEYERGLSVIGDDRRRPSAVNIHRVKEIQEEDRRESFGLRRRLSRAQPLRDDVNPLMAHALEKHQQEKALFRSASKQRESVKARHPTPAFSSSPFTGAGSSLPPIEPEDHNDLLDPLEKGQLFVPSSRSLSGARLSPYDVPSARAQRSGSPATTQKDLTPKASPLQPILALQTTHQSKIGTSLDS